MQTWKVVKVVDGDTFEVGSNWQTNGKKGNRVRIYGIDKAELGTQAGALAKRKLANLVLGKLVVLTNVRAVDVYRRLICDVYIDGKNIISLLG